MIFWREILTENRFRSFREKFRRPVSLLISLLFALSLIGALMDPVFSGKEVPTSTVILLDRSASMGATEEETERSRLDVAKERLLDLLPSIPLQGEVALVSFDLKPEIVVPFTKEGKALRNGITKVDLSENATSLTDAVNFARQLLTGRSESKILLLTDGNDLHLSEITGPDLSFLPIGCPSDNVGITRFQARRSLTGGDDYEILTEVKNFGTTPVSGRLEIDFEGTPVDVLPFSLNPDQRLSHFLPAIFDQGEKLHARLLLDPVTDVKADRLLSDNEATSVLPSRPVRSILLYGPTDFFSTRALAAQPGVMIKRITDLPDPIPPESILVIQGPIPPKLPSGNVLLIDPTGSTDLFVIGERLPDPTVATFLKDSPLFRFLSLDGLRLAGGRKITFPTIPAEIPPKDPVKEGSSTPLFPIPSPVFLAQTEEGDPLAIVWEAPDRKIFLLSANPTEGDLALRNLFPILFANALEWFHSNGSGDEAPLEEGGIGPDFRQEGNLRLAPADFYDGASPLHPFQTSPYRFPPWRGLAGLAFLLAILEWFLYHRRVID